MQHGVLFLCVLAIAHSSAEQIFNGAISYTPPIPMLGGGQAGNAGLPISGWEFRTESATTGYAQVTFQIMSVMALFNAPSSPPMEIRNTSDVRRFLETRSKGNTNFVNASVTLSRFSTREAVTCNGQTRTGPWKWHHSTYVLWTTNQQWPRNTLLHVFVVADKQETFDTLVKSLETATINPPPPVHLAQNKMALGMSQSEVQKSCGDPVESSGPNECYFTKDLMVSVTYGATDKVEYIAYSKVRDPQKAARAQNREELSQQLLPMNKAEVGQLLQSNPDEAPLSWSPAGENRWKRSDGAMAALHAGTLVVASRQMWPKIHFDKVKK